MRPGLRRLSAAAMVAVLGIAGIACGSTGDGDEASDSTTTTTAEVTTTTSASKVLERDIGKTVWWEGFEVSVDSLTAEPQPGGGVNLSIDVAWKNLLDASAFPPQPTLDFEGEVLTPSSDQSGEAGGQATLEGTLTAYIPEETNVVATTDALQLVWGESGDNQSIVPLDEDTEPTTFEPQELASFAGTVTTPTVVIDVSEGRYGWSYKSGDEGKFALTAHIKVSCGDPCPDEGTAMSLADLTLTVPGEDSPLSPDDELSEFCCVAVYPGTVDDAPTNLITFVVEGEPSGTYTLTYNPDRSEPVPGTLEFEV